MNQGGTVAAGRLDTQDADAPAVEFQDLHKRFGAQEVLRGVSLSVPQGETLVVLGRSGTGKSVLLKLIAGLQKPDSGSIHIHGQDVTHLDAAGLNAVRTKIGFLFQDAALYDSMTVEENVAFPLRHHQTQIPDHADRVRELLAFVGMEADRGKLPGEISGGMKKRVGLARALALEPDLLLFDEPTAGLDPITSGEIEQLICKLQKEHHVASIVVTHDLRGARAISHRFALMNAGRIVTTGAFEELEQSTDPFVKQFLRAAS
jgi:phospholipid/cholesterol/gamma-HCH transport system ATP-binding protein